MAGIRPQCNLTRGQDVIVATRRDMRGLVLLNMGLVLTPFQLLF